MRHSFKSIALVSTLAAFSISLPLLAGGMKVQTRTHMMMMDGTTTEWLSPDKKRIENHFESNGLMGSMMRMAGGGNSIIIERVDKGVVWTLDPEERRYSERPLNEPRQMGPPEKKERKGKDKGKMRVVDAGATVTVTGQKKTINGWPCTLYKVAGWIEMENSDTAERSKWKMDNEMWTTPEKPLLKRYRDLNMQYNRARMAKMGVTLDSADSDYLSGMGFEMMGGRNGLGGGDMAPVYAKMAVEMKKLSGVPIHTLFSWTVSGDAIKNESKKSAKKQEEMTPEQLEMMKSLGIKMPDTGGDGGMIISGETEIKSLADEEGDFEIPAGYKKE